MFTFRKYEKTQKNLNSRNLNNFFALREKENKRLMGGNCFSTDYHSIYSNFTATYLSTYTFNIIVCGKTEGEIFFLNKLAERWFRFEA